MSRDDFWYYPPTTPRAVTGGIKAQNKRGAFAGKWWGKRWLETLESFPIGARLSRGRAYARSGQVTSLQIDKGSLSARVQGSRKTPYKVTIKLKAFAAREWQTVLSRFAAEPILAARLLGNELAEEMEAVFKQTGLPLFPKKQNDLVTDCSCPDWSNPCKHVAAVYYLLAEAFDNDPFLLFKLRGMERDEFLAQLREAGGEEAGVEATTPEPEPAPLCTDVSVFWGGEHAAADAWRPTPQTIHAVLPKRLGPLPFWRGGRPFAEEMARIYACAAESALKHLALLEEGIVVPGDDGSVSSDTSPGPIGKLTRRGRLSEKSRGKLATEPPTNHTVAKGKADNTFALPLQNQVRDDRVGAKQDSPASPGFVPGGIPMRLLAAMPPGRARSRAELLVATGISAADWTWAIRQLKEEGLVVQEGEKRGARYRRSKS